VNQQSSEFIDTLLGKLFKLDGNTVVLKVEDNITVDMRIAKDAIDGMLRCFPGEPFCLIADCSAVISNAKLDAIHYSAFHEELNHFCRAQAIITDNLGILLMANFYASTIKKNKNVKLVKNMNEAQNWLNSNYREFIRSSSIPNNKADNIT